ncbi:hypothetical protein MDAP_001519 [Mitosporidium daphniae]
MERVSCIVDEFMQSLQDDSDALNTITLAIIKAKILSEDSSEEVKRVVEIEWPSVKEVIKARMEEALVAISKKPTPRPSDVPVQPQPTIPSKRRSISTERPASCSTKSDHPSAKRSSSNSSSRDSRSSKTVSTSKAKDHEKTLEKLKFYISKCGVRKNWKSELDGLPPLKCVEKLKGILADLGMTGRPSLAQCKAIKEKLELQRELDDLISSETERQDKPCASEEDASNDSQGLSDGETPPKKSEFFPTGTILPYLGSPPLGPLCFGEDFFSIGEFLPILSKLLGPATRDTVSSVESSQPEFSFDDFDDVLSASTQTSVGSDESNDPSLLLKSLNSHLLHVSEFIQKIDENYLASIGNVPLTAQSMLTHDIYSLEEDIAILGAIKQQLVNSLNKDTNL